MGEEMTLLQKANQYQRRAKRPEYTQEHFDLVKAWLKDEISTGQVASVLTDGEAKKGQAKAVSMIISVIREMVKQGMIKISRS